MNLLTAHRILIGAGVGFFVFYALWEFTGARGTGGGLPGMLRGCAALLAAGGLAVYWLTLRGRGNPGG